jgi:hypothetical protein
MKLMEALDAAKQQHEPVAYSEPFDMSGPMVMCVKCAALVPEIAKARHTEYHTFSTLFGRS